jgi:excisionase family DNA binding protein
MSNYRKAKAVQVVELPPQNAPIAARGLRVADAASYSGATVCMIRQAIRDKKLKALTIGKRFVILREDCDAWLNSLRASAA